MPRKTNTSPAGTPDPNKLYESQVIMICRVPMLGVLALETDNGRVDLAINKAVAETLLLELQEFVAGRAPMPTDLEKTN